MFQGRKTPATFLLQTRGGHAITKIESTLFSLGYMDMLSYRESPLHRLDPRAKLFATAVFLVAVLSFGKYQFSNLIPFSVYPIYLVSSAGIPGRYILKKLAAVSPFALMVAVFNPVFDREVIAYLGPWAVTGGWISFFSIMARFALTVGTVLALIACTGFYGMCNALERMKMPRVFVVQLLFLYRYMFVLAEEAARMVRARNARSFGARGRGISIFGPMAGTLLMRSINRARNIHRAMTSRGFDGEIRLSRQYAFGAREYLFILQWTAVFAVFRIWNVSRIAGDLFVRIFT